MGVVEKKLATDDFLYKLMDSKSSHKKILFDPNFLTPITPLSSLAQKVT
jgi:hypothetical protein